MKIGDKVTERIAALGEMKTGEVVYIHPEERYYVVEFKYLFSSIRESYPFPVPVEAPRKRGAGQK